MIYQNQNVEAVCEKTKYTLVVVLSGQALASTTISKLNNLFLSHFVNGI